MIHTLGWFWTLTIIVPLIVITVAAVVYFDARWRR